MQIHSKYDELLELNKFKNHPRNTNKHTEEQTNQMCKLISYYGIRHPIIVSKLSGFIAAGHLRLLAAKKLNLPTFPVVYQDFESEADEVSFLTADNAIAMQSLLDFSMINTNLELLDPSFDLELLGVKDFKIDGMPQVSLEENASEDKKPFHKLECEFANQEDLIETYEELLSRGIMVKIV